MNYKYNAKGKFYCSYSYIKGGVSRGVLMGVSRGVSRGVSNG